MEKTPVEGHEISTLKFFFFVENQSWLSFHNVKMGKDVFIKKTHS